MQFVFINTGTKRQNAGIIRCLGLGTGLIRSGHRVTILLPGLPENLQNYGSNYHGVDFIYTHRGMFREVWDKLLAIRSFNKIDAIHCMGSDPQIFLPAWICHLFARKNYLLVIDYEDKQHLLVPPGRRILHQLLTWLSLKFSDLIFCASRLLAAEYAGSSPGKTHYLPMGFEPSSCFSVAEPLHLAQRTPKNPKIGYLGNLILPYQDQMAFLIESFLEIQPEYPSIECHIVGDGPLRAAYEKMIIEKGLSGCFIFHGFVKDADLLPLLSGMDALVFPFSDIPLNQFRCPNKVFLYAQTGLPIVTNPVGEVYHLLRAYPNTHFFKQGCSGSFAHAVKAALANPPVTDGLHTFYKQNSWRIRSDEYLGKVCGKLFSDKPPSLSAVEHLHEKHRF